ncbi:MAG TPA: hypothetical protein VLD40_02640 [Dissulfurispiraceae bacterium]|nr:hypothetical protein [Dissulfurispiraceae bacterium]
MRESEKLIFIFVVGLLFLNWPLIEIFRAHIIPYLFVLWLVFILFVALANSRAGREENRNKSQ